MSIMKEAAAALTAACNRVGNARVQNLLATFGVGKLPDLQLRDVDTLIAKCNALQPEPTPVSMKPLFALGAKVQSANSCLKGFVTGYELHYIVDAKHQKPISFKGEDLRPQPVEVPPPAPVAADPVDFSPLYLAFERAERLLGLDAARRVLHFSSGVAIPSHVKAQDVNACIVSLRKHADAAALATI